MPDVFSASKRSEIMSRVRSRENKATEQALILIMRHHGLTGWRRNVALFGKPDFVFPKQRLAIFVDGCFWHSCPKHRTAPASNVEFWADKLRRNADRDRVVNRTLRKAGWKVVRIWQHDLKDHESIVRRLARYIRDADRRSGRA